MTANKDDITKALDFVGRAKRQRKVRLIEIDDREDKDGLTATLLTGAGFQVIRRRLPLGDYQWDSKLGRVVVERKTPSDAKDIGRLVGQVVRLRDARQAGCFPVLLMDYRDDTADKAWSDFGLDNVLMAVSGRIRIVRCLQGQLADRLENLYAWTQRSSHDILDLEV